MPPHGTVELLELVEHGHSRGFSSGPGCSIPCSTFASEWNNRGEVPFHVPFHVPLVLRSEPLQTRSRGRCSTSSVCSTTQWGRRGGEPRSLIPADGTDFSAPCGGLRGGWGFAHPPPGWPTLGRTARYPLKAALISPNPAPRKGYPASRPVKSVAFRRGFAPNRDSLARLERNGRRTAETASD